MKMTTKSGSAAIYERYADVFKHSRRQSVLPITLIVAAIS